MAETDWVGTLNTGAFASIGTADGSDTIDLQAGKMIIGGWNDNVLGPLSSPASEVTVNAAVQGTNTATNAITLGGAVTKATFTNRVDPQVNVTLGKTVVVAGPNGVMNNAVNINNDRSAVYEINATGMSDANLDSNATVATNNGGSGVARLTGRNDNVTPINFGRMTGNGLVEVDMVGKVRNLYTNGASINITSTDFTSTGRVDAGTGAVTIAQNATAYVLGLVNATSGGFKVDGTFKAGGFAALGTGTNMTVSNGAKFYVGDDILARNGFFLDGTTSTVSLKTGAQILVDDAVTVDNGYVFGLTSGDYSAFKFTDADTAAQADGSDLDALLSSYTVDGVYSTTTYTKAYDEITGNDKIAYTRTQKGDPNNPNPGTPADPVISNAIANHIITNQSMEFFQAQGGHALADAIAITTVDIIPPERFDKASADSYKFHSIVRSLFSNNSVNGFDANIAAGSAEERALINGYSGGTFADAGYVGLHTSKSVTGKIVGSGFGSRISTLLTQFDAADNAVASPNAMASINLNANYANRFWLGGFGVWEDAGYRKGDYGYKYESGGFIMGYDHVFANSIVVGGSFAYSTGDFEDKAALGNDSDIDAYSFSLYGLYRHRSGFFASLTGGHTYGDYDIKTLHNNQVNWENASYHSNTWSFGGKLGYEWNVACTNFIITPTVGLFHYDSRSSHFNTNLRNNVKYTGDQTELPIDIAFRYEFPVGTDAKMRVGVNGGYAYNFEKDDNGKVGFSFAGHNSPFVYETQGRDSGHDVWNVGANLGFSAGRFDFDVNYDYYTRKKTDTHQVFGTVGLSF